MAVAPTWPLLDAFSTIQNSYHDRMDYQTYYKASEWSEPHASISTSIQAAVMTYATTCFVHGSIERCMSSNNCAKWLLTHTGTPGSQSSPQSSLCWYNESTISLIRWCRCVLFDTSSSLSTNSSYSSSWSLLDKQKYNGRRLMASAWSCCNSVT